MNPEQNGGPLPPSNPNQFSQSPGEIPPAAPSHNPYDFIINPQKPAKKPVLAGTGNPMLMRILVAVGGLTLLLIAGVVLSSLLSSGSKEKTQEFLTVAQDQTELIRIASDGSTNATTLPGQNLAQNVQASITSDNTALLAYMAKNGQKITSKELSLKKNSSSDQTLAAARENSTYDTAFKDIIQQELQSYMVALQKAARTNPGPKGKALLSKQYDGAQLLIAQSKSN